MHAPRSMLLVALLGCTAPQAAPVSVAPGDTTVSFGDDLAFMRRHLDVVVLADGDSQVAVAPLYQGRVMTSTSGGAGGPSFGWINRDAIASGERKPHMNVFGGEDRFWLGPEGGQFSIYFDQGEPFDLEHWQVPEPIDWGAWEVVERSATQVRFQRDMVLVNYSGARFSLRVDRTVRLLAGAQLETHLGQPLAAGVSAVAYESDNRISNTGERAWTRETGLLSVWILGMYNPSPSTTVVLPFVAGEEAALGPIVNDAYFGKVPADRLVVDAGVMFFRGDGRMRSKIGIPRPRARPIAGSFDAASGVLTLVQYTLPADATDYVNSMWEIQPQPYGGDVVNSYNDGPPEPGKPPLGPFYELETSSPAAALAPGASLTHVHRTIHLQGDDASLDPIARAVLGADLARIRAAFGP